jgi:hypothetical protein
MQFNTRVVLNHGDEISLVINSRGSEKEREESFAVFIFQRPPEDAPDDDGEGESRTMSMERSIGSLSDGISTTPFSEAVAAVGSSGSAFTQTGGRPPSRGRSKRTSQKARDGSSGLIRQVRLVLTNDIPRHIGLVPHHTLIIHSSYTHDTPHHIPHHIPHPTPLIHSLA